MKSLIYIILLLLSFNSYSQPGDIIGWNINRVNEINSLLKIDTNNHQLLWERLEIVFNTHFNLYTQTRKPTPKSDLMLTGEDGRLNSAYKNINVLTDLNYLIADTTNITITHNYKKTITSANFYYKRGQYYYLNGEPEKALEDYLIALNKKPNQYLIDRISISIAAYYYNLDENFNLSNLEKALEYIDIAIPKEIENTPETFEYFTDRNHHPFEREKIMLLELVGKDIRHRNYLKSLAKSHLHLYNKEIQKSDEYKANHSHSIPSTLDKGFDYLFQIAKNYFKEKEYEKSEEILDLIIAHIPHNNNHYVKESPKYAEYYNLLSQIYSKACCKNKLKEIENLSSAIGSPSYGLNIEKELTENIDESLRLYPSNPKLLLAQAILIFKRKRGSIPTKAVHQIDSLLNNVEELGYVDYRTHYLRALVFKEQHAKYYEAIQELDKAIAIFNGNPQCYWQKYQILRKIPNYDEAKLKAVEMKAKSLTKQTANTYPISKNILQLISKIDKL